MTEQKLLRFMVEFVVPRGNQRKDLQPDGKPYPLGESSIDQYIKAIVDLYTTQVSSNQNHHAHPRGSALKAWKKSSAYQERDRNRDTQRDRGVGGIQDGYTDDELVKVCDYFFATGSELDLRDRMTFLFNHMLLLRGEDTRMLELADILTIDFKDEGPTECPALVLQFDGGKTNKNHANQYVAAIRHKNVRTCAISAMAMYFFMRWQKGSESFPTFETTRGSI